MENKTIEDKKNELNLLIRKALLIMDTVDGKKREYENYIEGSLDEEKYLDQQIKLMKEFVERYLNVFK